MIPINLDTQCLEALKSLARSEYRDPRAQAALIIRNELTRLGYLSPAQNYDGRTVTTASELSRSNGQIPCAAQPEQGDPK